MSHLLSWTLVLIGAATVLACVMWGITKLSARAARERFQAALPMYQLARDAIVANGTFTPIGQTYESPTSRVTHFASARQPELAEFSLHCSDRGCQTIWLTSSSTLLPLLRGVLDHAIVDAKVKIATTYLKATP
jgi:hypothetical protein